MRIAIQQEIWRSEDSRYNHRLRGLLLVTAGQPCRESLICLVTQSSTPRHSRVSSSDCCAGRPPSHGGQRVLRHARRPNDVLRRLCCII